MGKKKDALFLLQFFYPEYISSATLPFDTARALVRHGYSVDVLCGYPREYCDEKEIPKKETVDGIGIRRVKYLCMDRSKRLGRLINYFSFTSRMFLSLFRMRNYKTLYVYSNPPVLPWVAVQASRLFGCKLVFVAYDLYPEIATETHMISEDGMVARVMRHINKVVYKRASAVVALSGQMKEAIVEKRGIHPDKVHVIHNWYKDEYVGDSAEARWKDNAFADVAKGKFVVSYFGNMGVAQDLATLRDAMIALKDNPDVCFLLAGHGVKLEELKRTIENESISNAHVYGFLKGKDYLDALRASDCAVVSLEKGLTGLCAPSKTYSYMMQGLPLITIMEDSDICRDACAGAGVCVENGDADTLVRRILEMQRDPAGLKRMQDVCRRLYVENYTTEIATHKYVEMMGKL